MTIEQFFGNRLYQFLPDGKVYSIGAGKKLRLDQEEILGEPVTLDMPKACINPIDTTKTWEKEDDTWRNSYDSATCSWRQEEDGGIYVMRTYIKELKTVLKIEYEYNHMSRWYAQYNTITDDIPTQETTLSFRARALFSSGNRKLDILPDRYSTSKNADQNFIDNLNKGLKEVSKIVRTPSLYNIEDWGESYREWQVLVDEDIKIAVRYDGYGYMYIRAYG